MQARSILWFGVVAAGCMAPFLPDPAHSGARDPVQASAAPSPSGAPAPAAAADRGELTLAEGRARYSPARKPHGGPTGPWEVAEWRRMRKLDENGQLDPDARRVALAQREANIAAWGTMEGGGIGRYSWVERGPDNIGGRTRAIVIHPTVTSRIFVGTVGGGIWRSEDSGASWAPVDDWMGNLAVCSLAMAPTDPNLIYAGTGEGYDNADAIRGEGLWRSTDGGSTWTLVANTTGFGSINRIAISQTSTNTVLLATSGGIRRTTDGGTTWATVRTGNCYQVLISPTNANHVIAHYHDGAHRIAWSNNGGSTWATGAGGYPTGSRIELCWAPNNAGWAYASLGSGQCWRSTDNGGTWAQRTTTAISDGNQWWYDNAIWADPTNSSIVVIGAVNIWRSTNGGQTFTQISDGYINTSQPHPDVHFFAHDPGYDGTTNKTLYVAGDGSVYRTSDITTASMTSGWVRRDQNLRTVQFYGVVGARGLRLYGGTQDNGSLTVDASVSQAATVTFGADGGYVQMDPTDRNYLYGETQNLGMHRSTDGGATSTAIRTGLGDYATCTNAIAPFKLSPHDVNYLFAGGCSVWRCANAKAATPTWAAIKASIGSNVSAIGVDPNSADILWVGHNNGHVYRSDDARAATPTWTTVDDNNSPNPLPSRAVTAIMVDGNSSSRVFACFGGFRPNNLYRSTDNGATWTDVTGAGATGLPDAPIYGIAQGRPGRYYVATEVGVFGTSDDCATWSTSNDGPADVSADDICFLHNDNDTLLVGTHGRGMWTTTISDPLVGNLGAGCAGSAGVPALTATPPRLGVGTTLSASNLPANQILWLAQGSQATSWFGNPLPFHLDGFGATNCYLRVAPEILRDGVADASGTWTANLPIAANTWLLGRTFRVQLFTNDRAANAWGHAASNALTLFIGN